MFIISAIIDFETEKERDEVVKISIPIQKATREQELGCISYCFAADPVVANRMQVYELWEDERSVVEHFKHKNYRKMLSLFMESNIITSENQIYRIDRHEPVYDIDGNPKESFFR